MKSLHKIINTSLLLSAFMCTGMNANAQDTVFPNRDISVKILNKKGRPLPNIIVQSRTGKAGITDRSGLYVFEDMSDNDTLSVRLGNNGQIIIPVKDMDFIMVKAVSARYYSYFNQQDGDDDAVIVRKLPLSASEHLILDVPEMLKQRSYSSLIELLRGQVSGINVSPEGQVTPVGGPNSIINQREPLVLMDGVDMGTLSAANSMVSVYDVKTIEIRKNGAGYGVRGAGGVILIRTQ